MSSSSATRTHPLKCGDSAGGLKEEKGKEAKEEEEEARECPWMPFLVMPLRAPYIHAIPHAAVLLVLSRCDGEWCFLPGVSPKSPYLPSMVRTLYCTFSMSRRSWLFSRPPPLPIFHDLFFQVLSQRPISVTILRWNSTTVLYEGSLTGRKGGRRVSPDNIKCRGERPRESERAGDGCGEGGEGGPWVTVGGKRKKNER